VEYAIRLNFTALFFNHQTIKCLVCALIYNIKENKGVYRRVIDGQPSTPITLLYTPLRNVDWLQIEK